MAARAVFTYRGRHDGQLELSLVSLAVSVRTRRGCDLDGFDNDDEDETDVYDNDGCTTLK